MPYDAQGNYVADTATPTIDPSGNLSITPTATAAGGFFSDLVDFLGNSSVNQALRTGGEYYLGRENIQDVQRLGREQQEQAAILAERARAGTEFKPYTVTSGLGQVVTDPTGGIAVQLSPEQQALQAQLQGKQQVYLVR